MRLITLFAACGLLLAATAAQAAPMKFQVLKVNCPENCTRVLFGEGDITTNTDRSFRWAKFWAGRNTPVLLNSPGGDLAGGLKLGVAFRLAGSWVGVAPGGACFSACAYALFGGVTRAVLPGGQLGVHEFVEVGRDPKRRLTRAEKKQNEGIVELLNIYAEGMGVSPKVIDLALATRQNEITILSRKQLKRMRVVTG